MIRVIIFIAIIINLGCIKKGDLGISKNSSADTFNLTDSLSQVSKNSLTHELTGEIYPVRLAPPMQGMGVVSIQFSKGGSTKILDNRNNVFVTLDFGAEKISFDNKAYNFTEVSNQMLEQSHRFYPWMNALEYEILIFDCINMSEEFYEISVNNKEGITGRVPIGDPNIIFYTWKELLLKSYISFDPKSNPLRFDPSDQSKIVYPYNDYFFKVIEVRDDWIKVECSSDCKECEKGNLTGWIKWKEGNNFLIQIGLIC